MSVGGGNNGNGESDIAAAETMTLQRMIAEATSRHASKAQAQQASQAEQAEQANPTLGTVVVRVVRTEAVVAGMPGIESLVLVSVSPQTAKNNSREPGDSEQFVVGLQASEMQVGRHRIVHVAKIDSAGNSNNSSSSIACGGIASVVVQTFLAFLAHVAHVAADSDDHEKHPEDKTLDSENLENVLQVHVFARAQPQYLFPLSAACSSKRVRSDDALVGWWLRLLGPHSNNNNNNNNEPLNRLPFDQLESAGTRRLWLIPGESATSTIARRLVPPANRPPLCPTGWTWGLGTLPFSASSGTLPLLPCFADDPITKAVEMLRSSSKGASNSAAANIQGVTEMLAVVGECQRVCALLCVQWPLGHLANLVDSAGHNREHYREHLIDRSRFDAFLDALLASDFRDADAHSKSSKLLIEWFAKHIGSSEQYIAKAPVPIISTASESSFTPTPATTSAPVSKATSASVAKQASTSSSSNQSNQSNQSSESGGPNIIQNLVKRRKVTQ